MRNKLRVLSIGILLTAGFGLAACDTVEAKLPEAMQSDKILAIDGTIPHNEIEELFESVVPSNSTTASKVLDSLLVKLAKSYFGDFYVLRDFVENNKVSDIKSFVDNHARLQVTKDDGSRNSEAEVQGVVDLYEHLLIAIQKSFWSNVSSSSYTDRYFFVEKKFYDTQKAALYNLDEDYGEALEDDSHLTQLDGVKDYKNVDEYFGGLQGKDYLDVYNDYIERSILPDIYRKLIVENYLQRNNYSALGRSHARKVQTISLKNIDDASDATRNLITHYANYILEGNILEAEDKPASVSADDIEELSDLKFLSRLYDGLVDVNVDSVEADVATYLYAKANWSKASIDIDEDPQTEPIEYYPLTKLGKIYKDYSEITDTRWETSSSTDFTGSGAYTKRTGLMLKEREVFSKNAVNEGWYTSSGLSDLPSTLRSRLFKIQVANDVDSNYDSDFHVVLNKEMNYGMYVNGHYYLTPETYEASTAHPYVIYSDGSWVIVRVDEAVKGPKLVKESDSTTSYAYLYEKGLRGEDKATQNEIVWLVSDMIAGSDTYTKAARQEVIEAAKIVYHDQSVYDYFKSNFPDLFD